MVCMCEMSLSMPVHTHIQHDAPQLQRLLIRRVAFVERLHMKPRSYLSEIWGSDYLTHGAWRGEEQKWKLKGGADVDGFALAMLH